jgi:hypothetical protein
MKLAPKRTRRRAKDLPQFQIEAISTGKVVGYTDDFTGEELPQPNAKPPKIQDAQEWRNEQHRAKVRAAQALLEMAKPKPKPQTGIIFKTKTGDEYVVTMPKHPLRRI